MKKMVEIFAVMTFLIMSFCSCSDKIDYSLLDKWKGTYIVSAQSYFGESLEPPVSDYDETWTVTVEKVEGSETQLAFSGIGGEGSATVYASLDIDKMTISFDPGQELGDLHDYGVITICYGTDDIIQYAGSDIDQTYVDAAADIKIEGTIKSDGSIEIDRFAEIVEGPSVWDVFNTSWTKN